MKYFPLKTLMILVILVPGIYILSVGLLESRVQKRYATAIENLYIGDPQPLLDGTVRLKDAVAANIDTYLRGRVLTALGIRADVTVMAGNQIMLYPAFPESDAEALSPPSPRQIASDNFDQMNAGLSVNVKVSLARGSFLDIGLFLLMLLAGGIVFLYYYRRGLRRARVDEAARREEIRRLEELEKRHYDRIMALNEEKDLLEGEIDRTRKNLLEYRASASQTEDQLIDEMVALEEKVQKSMALSEELRRENEALRQVAAQQEDQEKQKSGKKSTVYGTVDKRFKTLYKQTLMHKRALDSFMGLTDELKIKAEEVVKQLDTDASGVDVKRKVDLRKSREKIFEVGFAYNGRLYFRNLVDGRVEVLIIGTKNSQVKDMSFLDTL
ncbi:MAG: hypothetical protein ACOZBW_08070 [Thermodesulfobacteriota bacterium]